MKPICYVQIAGYFLILFLQISFEKFSQDVKMEEPTQLKLFKSKRCQTKKTPVKSKCSGNNCADNALLYETVSEKMLS